MVTSTFRDEGVESDSFDLKACAGQVTLLLCGYLN